MGAVVGDLKGDALNGSHIHQPIEGDLQAPAIFCVQHSTQWIDGMSRIMAGSIGDAPAELVATVREFLTREIGR